MEKAHKLIGFQEGREIPSDATYTKTLFKPADRDFYPVKSIESASIYDV